MTDSTRRDFIKTAAALAAIPAIELPGHATTTASVLRVPDDEPVNIAVIGTGGMGTGHTEALVGAIKEGRTNTRVIGLADVCEPRLQAARKKVEDVQGADSCKAYSNYHALLERPDLHGVLIASPEHWHADMAIDAMKAGKDVYVEKPMTRWLRDAFRVMDAVRDHPDRIVIVGTQFVLSPSTIEARKQVEGGAIGKAVWSQTSYCRNSKDGEWLYYAIDPAWQPGVNLDWNAWCGPMPKEPWNPEVYARWRRYRKWSTGIVGDLLVHKITPLVYAVNPGWPVRVVASGGHYVDKVMENHDQVNINVEFENEHTMVIAGSTANQEGLPTVIRGHKANLFLDGRKTRLQPEQLFANEVEEQTFEGENHGDDQDALRLRWLDSIRTREPSVSPVELATKVMVIVELATRSMWEGAAFSFNPATRKVKKL